MKFSYRGRTEFSSFNNYPRFVSAHTLNFASIPLDISASASVLAAKGRMVIELGV